MKRRAISLLALALLACGAPSRVAPTVMETRVEEVAGTRIAVLPRATRGRVWLSLWIDAGARDADPAQVATVATWIAAGDEVSAEVMADGIELTRACNRDELDACLRSLASVVQVRDVSANALHAARQRLTETRRRVHVDDTRRADALALRALLGHGADPLGVADDDDRVTPQAVSGFLRDHVGAGRLLLVAIGDVDPDALRRKVSTAFGHLPPAAARRAHRAHHGERALRVEIGEKSVVSAATLRPHLRSAARLARTLVARVEADAPGARVSADVFPARGGAALIARIHGDHGDAQRALFDHLIELSAAPTVENEDPLTPADGPRGIARWMGARWAANQANGVFGGLGVGAIARGGRADRVGEQDPDAATREAARRELEARIRAASEHPLGEGTRDEHHAALTLVGGARLYARRLAGADRVSAVVLFDGGAAEDSPRAHGATALLARSSAAACHGTALRELGEGLEVLGVDVTPILQPDAWGLRVEGPTPHWRDVAYLATRCASLPSLDPWSVDRARDEVMAMAQRTRARVRAIVAQIIAPSAPGRIAPLGAPAELSRVHLPELRRMRRSRATQARARIAIAGDVPIEEASDMLARGAARWLEGAPREPQPWIAPAERLASAEHPERRFGAVIAWVMDAPANATVASSAFARAAAASLALEPGLSVLWQESGAAEGRAWVLVGLGATPEAIDMLPSHLSRALSGLSHATIAEEAVAEADERYAWTETSPRSVAMMLATDAAEPPTREETERTLSALAASTPTFIILRPRPGDRS